jgi:hypothetical protein
MFVRWQQFRPQRRPDLNGDRLQAVLVEAVRIDGKPRQKHVAVLGSIKFDKRYVGHTRYEPILDAKDGKRFNRYTEDKYEIGLDKNRVRRFWYDVTKRIKGLDNRLSEEDRGRVLAALNKRVEGRFLTDAEIEQFEREREQFLASLRNMFAPARRS